MSPMPALVVGLAAYAAPAEPVDRAHGAGGPPWAPTVGVSVGQLSERVRLETNGAVFEETRTDLRASAAIGLAHAVWADGTGDARVALDGHASVALGSTFAGGRWQLSVREDLTLAWSATPWLTVRSGIGTGFVLDATRPSSSQFEIGAPISLAFLDFLEIVARPALAVGVADTEQSVFGGTRAIGPGVAPIPLDVTLRLRPRALRF